MAQTGSVWQTNQFSAGTGRDDEPSEVRGKLAHAVLMGQAAGRGAISRARTQSQEDGPARRHRFALCVDLPLLLEPRLPLRLASASAPQTKQDRDATDKYNIFCYT